MIEINNLTNFPVDKKKFSTVAKKVLLGENRRNTCRPAGRETISVAFVNEAEMKKLNDEFRQKNKPTDVLSFELKEGNLLGEVVICPAVVKKNAKKYGVSFKKEMLKVFVHGILHLCGYDHEKSEKEAKKMEEKQDFYLLK
ncbi:MAG: rRNA maturation RNase YbeY [Candidatus Staskawiczbacteria bacterium]|nr:rRNA maturation RNase YbeY [Candidatus Staskawiczbacteria bacterium]